MKLRFAKIIFLGACLLSPAGVAAATMDFAYTGAIETWSATQTGKYRITAVGAQGASASRNFSGGRGAKIAGSFSIKAGEKFKVLVGGAGSVDLYGSGGGGGGTFFVSWQDTPLLIAGGGGGTRVHVLHDGIDASITERGYAANHQDAASAPAFSSQAPGMGGLVASGSWGSAGAGFHGNGADDAPGGGGKSWANGMQGGRYGSFGVCSGANGGFGGGGSGNGCFGGGGGGGYTGGDGGRQAGGGGSFNAGIDAFALAGAGHGNGSLSIAFLHGEEAPAPVPLPASLPLLLAGVGGLVFLRRRRKS